MENMIPVQRIERHIFIIRGQRVMFDTDLAQLYEVQTKTIGFKGCGVLR